MLRTRYRFLGGLLVLFALVGVTLSAFSLPARAESPAQMPTGSLATVTSTPSGPMAVVKAGTEPQINLRSGPNALYERVGVLLAGQRVPAKGRTAVGEWVQVEYPGAPNGLAWVYASYIEIIPPVQLPIIEPPPTPTLAMTATIDPTLAARFVITVEPTRLPTFTQPPPLAIPTFAAVAGPSVSAVPMGFVILGLAALGVFLGIVAFSQR